MIPITSISRAEMPSSPKNFMPVVEEVKWERTTTESRISTVIGMLPASLQSRMGPLRTFRRTTSLGNIDLVEGVATSTKALSRPRPLSAAETQTMSVRDAEEAEEVESVSSAATKNSDSPSPGSRDRDTGGTPVSSSGINWKLGLQGNGLVGIASDASRDDQSKDLERKAYLDGLTYLLRGLPPNLEPSEAAQLQSALPPTLKARNNSGGSGSRSPFRSRSGSRMPDSGAEAHHRSFIHRAVQMVVVNLLLLAHFVLPYAVMLLKSAAGLERKYKVSETLVGHGMTFFNAVGSRGSRVVEVVLNAGDGRSGECARGVATWLLEEVTRGVSDGLGEGLCMVKYREAA